MILENFSETILQAAKSTSVMEWIATITAVIYVILAARENIFCWHFGAISSALSVAVYFKEQLVFEAILNVIYCIISIYGWWEWKKNKKEKSDLKISRMKMKTGLYILCIGIFCSLIFGGISNHYHTSQLPYADASITAFSILATWMTAKKILENWIAWIIIDAAAVGVYIYKGPSLYLFALLFIFYTFISITGYLSWRKKIQSSAA